MKINQNLLWDYEFSPKERKTKKFKQWYLSRVLSHGTSGEVAIFRDSEIRNAAKTASLPSAVKKFWQWYFDYGNPHAVPTASR